jgi:hypothetical protein
VSYAAIPVEYIQPVKQPTIKYNLLPFVGYFSPVCVDSSNILKDSILTSLPTNVYVNIKVKTTKFCVKNRYKISCSIQLRFITNIYIYKHQSTFFCTDNICLQRATLFTLRLFLPSGLSFQPPYLFSSPIS